MYFVDLRLPQYDITQGKNLYDDVLAAEFCVALSRNLEAKSAVYVRDAKALSTVTRLFEARERRSQEERMRQQQQDEYEEVEVEVEILVDENGVEIDEDEEDDDEWEERYDDEDDDDDDDIPSPEPSQSDPTANVDDSVDPRGDDSGGSEATKDVVFYDDFGGVGFGAVYPSGEKDEGGGTVVEYYDDFADLSGGTFFEVPEEKSPTREDQETKPIESPQDDIESFRAKLLGDEAPPPKKKKERRTKIVKKKMQVLKEKPPIEDAVVTTSKNYRLGSLFGDAKVSTGADMTEDVVGAVRANALLEENEDTMIILSAISAEETIAIRGLVNKYQSEKQIVLVNCSLSPTPRELSGAVMAYSLTPFVARSTSSEGNIFGGSGEPEESSKIVVMLRYPGDWDIFVDSDGEGFELAKSIPATRVDRLGPSLETIAETVKEHLQSKLD